MDIFSPQAIKFLCGKYKILPQKSLGQNFLISQNVLDKIIGAAALKKDDIVLEIGSGLGVLTIELAKRVKKVIAVEKDKKMVGALKEIIKDYKNIEVVEGDILKIFNFQFSIFNKPQNLKPKTYKIVANLPYQITSAVLRKFLTEEPRPQEMVLMVQKEVGEKICAKLGEMSLLSVAVQFYAQPEIILSVSKNNFWPKPKVDSVIVRICTNLPQIKIPLNLPRIKYGAGSLKKGENQIPLYLPPRKGEREEVEEFFRIVKAGFSRKRRQLKNNLGAIFKKKDISSILEKIGLNPKVRAEDLSVEDWVRLVDVLNRE